MAQLDVDSERYSLEGGETATLLRVRGSVDTATVSRLDDALSEVAESGCLFVVLDLSGLDYVNSRGISILVKHHDAAASAGGRLVLAALPKKIYATFQTMGVDEAFVLQDEIDAAFEALKGAPPAPSAADPTSFPLTFRCDACIAPLTAERPGKYRCPRCHGPFEVTPDGRAVFFPARNARSVEITLPCRANYVKVARAAGASLAEDLELSAIPSELLDGTVDETIGLFVGKAGEDAPSLRLFVSADNREFTVAVVVTDESLLITDDDQEDVTFRRLKSMVDDLEVLSLEPDGQLLKLVKRLGM